MKKNVSTRGRQFVGKVVSAKAQKTVTVVWPRLCYVPKYERYLNKRTKVKAHNPECMGAVEGDIVKIMECRPLSKTKNFVITEVMGQEKGFIEKIEGREEAKVKDTKEEIVEEPKESPSKKEDKETKDQK